MQEQVEIWDGLWPVRFFKSAPAWLVQLVTYLLGVLLFNRFVLWCPHPYLAIIFLHNGFPMHRTLTISLAASRQQCDHTSNESCARAYASALVAMVAVYGRQIWLSALSAQTAILDRGLLGCSSLLFSLGRLPLQTEACGMRPGSPIKAAWCIVLRSYLHSCKTGCRHHMPH